MLYVNKNCARMKYFPFFTALTWLIYAIFAYNMYAVAKLFKPSGSTPSVSLAEPTDKPTEKPTGKPAGKATGKPTEKPAVLSLGKSTMSYVSALLSVVLLFAWTASHHDFITICDQKLLINHLWPQKYFILALCAFIGVSGVAFGKYSDHQSSAEHKITISNCALGGFALLLLFIAAAHGGDALEDRLNEDRKIFNFWINYPLKLVSHVINLLEEQPIIHRILIVVMILWNIMAMAQARLCGPDGGCTSDLDNTKPDTMYYCFRIVLIFSLLGYMYTNSTDARFSLLQEVKELFVCRKPGDKPHKDRGHHRMIHGLFLAVMVVLPAAGVGMQYSSFMFDFIVALFFLFSSNENNWGSKLRTAINTKYHDHDHEEGHEDRLEKKRKIKEKHMNKQLIIQEERRKRKAAKAERKAAGAAKKKKKAEEAAAAAAAQKEKKEEAAAEHTAEAELTP